MTWPLLPRLARVEPCYRTPPRAHLLPHILARSARLALEMAPIYRLAYPGAFRYPQSDLLFVNTCREEAPQWLLIRNY